jgi:hypothetical protein
VFTNSVAVPVLLWAISAGMEAAGPCGTRPQMTLRKAHGWQIQAFSVTSGAALRKTQRPRNDQRPILSIHLPRMCRCFVGGDDNRTLLEITMSNKKTGGPAFPFPSDCSAGEPGELGMTLRDYFAAKAMQQVMAANPVTGQYPHISDFGDVAESAYAMADAMLAAREAA